MTKTKKKTAMNELFPENLLVFSTPGIELAFENSEDIFYNSLIPINNNQVEFLAHSFERKAKDLNNIYLYCKLKLVKTGGNEYDGTEKNGSVINNLVASLIKSVSLTLNQVQVYSCENYFAYKDIFEIVSSYNRDVAGNILSSQGFFHPHESKNKLAELVKGSVSFDLVLKLNLVQTNKFLIPGVSLGLKILFQDPSFYLFETKTTEATSTTAAEYTKSEINILEMKLMIPHKQINETHLLELEKALTTRNASYQFKKSVIMTSVVPTGVLTYFINNIYSGIKPSLLLACIVKNSDISGDRTSPTYTFEHQNSNFFAFLINDQRYPAHGFKYNFSAKEKSYAQTFLHTMMSLNLHSDNESCLLSYESYEKNFLIISDVTKGGNALTSLRQPMENVSIGCQLSFNEKTTEALNVIIYGLLDSSFEINYLRDVSLQY